MMITVDIAKLRPWIGKDEVRHDVLSPGHARLMAATLGLSPSGCAVGAPLPPLWHWIYFLDAAPPDQLGRDGHPMRGGFLPPVPLANRMWAGSRLVFHTPLPLGATVERRSRVESVELKQGQSGELVFVTVLHEILLDGRVAISEHQDLVYKESAPPGLVVASPKVPEARHSKPFSPTSTTLFRYSALTFNGHRIHYDVDYCREVEGYANLVVHGPLNATLLAAFAEEIAGRPVTAFSCRGVMPSLLGQALTVNAAPVGEYLALWIGLPDGKVGMTATAFF